MHSLVRSFLLSAATLTLAAGCTRVPQQTLPAPLQPSKDYRYKIDKSDAKNGNTIVTYNKKSIYCVGGFRESLTLKFKHAADNSTLDTTNIAVFKFVKKKFYSLDHVVRGWREPEEEKDFSVVDYKENDVTQATPTEKMNFRQVREVTQVLPGL